MQRHLYLASTYLQLHVLHPLLNIVVVRMHQYNKNKTDGFGTWPEFEKGMYFYVPVGVILIELEDCSNYATRIESKSLLHDETAFVSSNDTMTNRDYSSVQQNGSFVLTTGDWRLKQDK
jgi:hypothetical protein